MIDAHAGGSPRGALTLSLLGSSLRTLSVPMNQRPLKASRRVRTTLIQHGTLGMRGVPIVLTHYTAWDSPHGKLNMLCQGGDASRVQLSTSPHSQPTRLVALPVCSSFRAVRPIVLEEHDNSQKSEDGRTQPKYHFCPIMKQQRIWRCSCFDEMDESTNNKNNTHKQDTTYHDNLYASKLSRSWVQFLLRVGRMILSFILIVHRLRWHVCFLFFCISSLCITSCSFLLRKCLLRSCAFPFVIHSHTTKSLTGGVLNTSRCGTLASVQYVPFPPVGSSAVEVL